MAIKLDVESRALVHQFLVTIAGYQLTINWQKIDPITALSLLGFKSGDTRSRTLRDGLQNHVGRYGGKILLVEITKKDQTVAGLIARGLVLAGLMKKEPSGKEWIEAIAALQEAGI